MSECGNLLSIFSLAPYAFLHTAILFSFLFMVNSLLRTALMPEATRSVVVHMLVCVLTLLPAVVMAGTLWLGAYHYPERAWINMGIAALLYLPWYAGGKITKLVRPDTEGADVGWLGMGALITFPAGIIAAILFR